jgi:hypothetical protein
MIIDEARDIILQSIKSYHPNLQYRAPAPEEMKPNHES